MKEDEISMSWNKKVSLKEIAQFYENKLRELDAKQNMIEQEIDKALQKIGQKTQDLENSIENIKRFVDKLNETQKSIENLRDEINKKDKILDERIGFFDQNIDIIIGKIDILRNALKEFIGVQTIRNEEFFFTMNFVFDIITPKYTEQIRDFIKHIKAEQSAINDEKLRNAIFVGPSIEKLKVDLGKNPNISLIVQPNEQFYKYLSLYALKSYSDFLWQLESLLRKNFDDVENKNEIEDKDEYVSVIDKKGKIVAYPINLDINKNKTKEEKERKEL